MNTTIDGLINALTSKDLQTSLDRLIELNELVRTNAETAKWLTEPQNITNLHNLIVNNFNISPRLLMLKNRTPNRGLRAVLFAKSMENAIRRKIAEETAGA